MTIHEIEPRFRIGQYEIGKKTGSEAKHAQYSYLEEHTAGIAKGVHELVITIENRDTVLVKCKLPIGHICPMCYERTGYVARENINSRPGLNQILRWKPSSKTR